MKHKYIHKYSNVHNNVTNKMLNMNKITMKITNKIKKDNNENFINIKSILIITKLQQNDIR